MLCSLAAETALNEKISQEAENDALKATVAELEEKVLHLSLEKNEVYTGPVTT